MSKKQGKNIVLCSDGTGNTMVKGRGSNVWKLYEAIDLTEHRHSDTAREQIAFYDDGVGSEDNKLLKIVGGAFGFGLSRNVRDLYSALCRAWRPGDEIYLFGFSRGAFTVRTLAGLILTCGIIEGASGMTDDELNERIKKAWKAFRSQFSTWQRDFLSRMTGTTVEQQAQKLTEEFRNDHSVDSADQAPKEKIRIRFIGVWDTVSAVGFPFKEMTDFWNAFIYPFKFPDYKLSPDVEKASHALAIDDERHTFHPMLWDEEDEQDNKRIEQVWFAGVHSNIGGGYPKQGLSLASLDWMMHKAEDGGNGLRFVPGERERYRHLQNVHDKLYDSRSGLAVYYRYKPRDIAELCRENHVFPEIHVSAMERLALATQGYAPGNLPEKFRIVCTDPDRPAGCEDTVKLSEVVEKLNGKSPEKALLLDQVKSWVRVRRIAHACLIFGTITILGFAIGHARANHEEELWVPDWVAKWVEKGSGILPFGEKIHDYLLVPFMGHPLASLFLVFMLILFLVARISRRAMRRSFSGFWRKNLQQPWWD